MSSLKHFAKCGTVLSVLFLAGCSGSNDDNSMSPEKTTSLKADARKYAKEEYKRARTWIGDTLDYFANDDLTPKEVASILAKVDAIEAKLVQKYVDENYESFNSNFSRPRTSGFLDNPVDGNIFLNDLAPSMLKWDSSYGNYSGCVLKRTNGYLEIRTGETPVENIHCDKDNNVTHVVMPTNAGVTPTYNFQEEVVYFDGGNRRTHDGKEAGFSTEPFAAIKPERLSLVQKLQVQWSATIKANIASRELEIRSMGPKIMQDLAGLTAPSGKPLALEAK